VLGGCAETTAIKLDSLSEQSSLAAFLFCTLPVEFEFCQLQLNSECTPYWDRQSVEIAVSLGWQYESLQLDIEHIAHCF
jgi:hypothetical protein